MTKNFILGGEAGDAIYALPAVQSLGGGVLWAVDRPWTRPEWASRSKCLTRLMESQGLSLRQGEPRSFDHDLTTYRSLPSPAGTPISARIAKWVGVNPDFSKPWIDVDTSSHTKGRIIVSRGPRWRGWGFPWKQIVKTFRKEILFVGLDDEYQDFCQEFGMVDRLPTKDLLDVAQAIKGSELFIGSQSSPNAVCEALKHPSILEVCPTSLDCIYHRDTTKYVVDGSVSFEACGQTFVSPIYREPTNRLIKYRLLFNNNEIFHHDFTELQFIGRAAYVAVGKYPTLEDIKIKIEQDSRQLI